MTQLIQAIANFSDGTHQDIVAGLKKIAENGKNHTLMGSTAEADYNRSGFYLLGQADSILDTVFDMVAYAVEHIDMTKQKGLHPRIGSGDVIALVPIKGVTMEECSAYCEKLGQRIGQDLDLPVYLFGESAKTEERRSLSYIRKGEFEGFAEKIKKPEWKPDFGPDQIHPTAGVTAIGARQAMISLNVNLSTQDMSIAEKITQSIREINGGLVGLKAIALDLDDKEGIQISTTIEDYTHLPFYRVLEMIKIEARTYGVSVVDTEVYGIVPAQVMIESAAYYLQAHSFNSDKQILENYLL